LSENKKQLAAESCRFGHSNQSKLFIGIIAVFIIIFMLVGFLVGHRSVAAFKRKHNVKSKWAKDNSSSYSDEGMLKKPMSSTANLSVKSEHEQNKSSLSYSIPRPKVRSDSK